MSLATLSQYIAMFQVPSPDTAAQARIQTMLDISTGLIQNGRRLFYLTTDEVVFVDGTGRQSFQTPKNRLPVVAVDEIQESRDFETDFSVVDPTSYDWDEYGIITLNGRVHPYWTSRRRCLQVTYTHGYATIPADVMGICLSLAKRLYDDPAQQSIAVEQLGDAHFEYAGGTLLLPDEVRTLSTYEVPV